MKIVCQTNEQECGICVLTSLHNHFYTTYINKQEALEKSQISDSGMTIFDFEALGAKLGLECESYELNFAEFTNLKINSYFVLLLSTKISNNHYVIARKKKQYIEIYDSCSSTVKKLSYKDLQKVFLNVVILVKKSSNKAFKTKFNKANELLLLDLKFILLNLGLSIAILALSVLSASFLNYIIDIAIAKSSVSNLITICFIFILVYFCNDILAYISHIYMARHVKNNFILFTSKILTCLENKNPDFLNKVDKNWIYKVDECVYSVANFCVVEINKFITNIIFCIVCICIIGFIQYYLLIFIVLYSTIEFIFFLFNYRKKKEVFLNIIRSENNNAQYYKDLIYSLNNELWLSKRKNLIERIKDNYSNIYKNYSDVILFKSNSSLFKSILKSLCEILVIGAMSYLIIKNNNLTIGQLTFVVSAFALYRGCISETFSYFLSKIEFDVYWQVYSDLTTISNSSVKNKPGKNTSINKIAFKNPEVTLFVNKSNNITQPIFNLLKSNKEIIIDNKNKQINDLLDLFIVLDQHTNANISLLLKQIELKPELYAQYIRYFQLDLNQQSLPFYDNLIVNLLNLLSEKNKIIFIDDILSFVKKSDKSVVKQLILKIKKHNSVFIIWKEEND